METVSVAAETVNQERNHGTISATQDASGAGPVNEGETVLSQISRNPFFTAVSLCDPVISGLY